MLVQGEGCTSVLDVYIRMRRSDGGKVTCPQPLHEQASSQCSLTAHGVCLLVSTKMKDLICHVINNAGHGRYERKGGVNRRSLPYRV